MSDETTPVRHRAEVSIQKRWRPPVSAVAALVAAAIPLLTAIALLGVARVRLAENERRLEDVEARVASTWLADRLALLGRGSWETLLTGSREALGAHVGAFRNDGEPVGDNDLDQIDAKLISRVLAGEIDELKIGGQRCRVAAATLPPPLSSIGVVVAVREGLDSVSQSPPLLRLGLLGLLLVVAAALLGRSFGVKLSSSITALGRWLSGCARRADQSPRPPPGPTRDRDTERLARAAARLDERTFEELSGVGRRRAEAELRDERRSDLFSAVAVDLHLPIDTVIGTTRALLDGEHGELQESQRDDIAIVNQASSRLKGMLGDIADFSNLVDGEIEFDDEPVGIATLAREVVETARGQVGKKRLELRVEIGSGAEAPPAVPGNRDRLWQVLTNLVGNAIKFTEKGAVTVGVRRDEGGGARIDVEDTGVGISRSDLSAVFDTFRQLGAVSRRKRGTGLGLPICKRLVQLHGGTIDVSSSSGRGTRVTVRLPEAR